jgi:hypothetical protein
MVLVILLLIIVMVYFSMNNLNNFNGFNQFLSMGGCAQNKPEFSCVSGVDTCSIGQATSVVIRKGCGPNYTLVGLQPTDKNQILITNDLGSISWASQCTLAGMNNVVTSIRSGGILINTTAGSSNGCLRTLLPTNNNQVPVVDNLGNLTWIDISSLTTGMGTVTNILTVDGITGGPITTSGTIGLDGWEIVTGSKIFRPKTGIVGKLGDPTHVITEADLITLILYNSTVTHSITTRATSNYKWSTPISNPSILSLVSCNAFGNLDYLQASSSGQILVSSGGGVPTWINQCDLAGLNTTVTSLSANTSGSGIVLNNGNLTDCLRTLISPGINQVLVTDGTNNIKWIPQSSIGGGGGGSGTVTQINTIDGITGGPITTMGTLGLDSWQIDPVSKSLRPKISNIGTVGDSTHIVNQGYYNTLTLNNGANFQNITTRATSTYNWSTPIGNPVSTSLITCDISGNLNYSTPGGNNSVLTTNNLGALTWIQQCAFAGLNNTTSSLNANNVGSGIVLNTGTASNCLETLTSSVPNQVLTTDGSNNIKWASLSSVIPDDELLFEATYNPLVSTGFTGSGDEIIKYDTVLQNNLPELTYTSITGTFTFSVSGRYKISADLNFAITSIGNQGNTFCKLSFINGTNIAGTELFASPVLFGNNKSAGGRYIDKTLNFQRSINIVAGQTYIIALRIISDDASGITELSPSALAPLNPFPVIAGFISINRIKLF